MQQLVQQLRSLQLRMTSMPPVCSSSGGDGSVHALPSGVSEHLQQAHAQPPRLSLEAQLAQVRRSQLHAPR